LFETNFPYPLLPDTKIVPPESEPITNTHPCHSYCSFTICYPSFPSSPSFS